MELPPKHVRFTHTPLNFKNKEIRVVTIHTSSDLSSPVQITIQNVDFSGHSDALLSYRENLARREPTFPSNSVWREAVYNACFFNTFDFIALSYTWGPVLPTQDIFITSPECRGWFSVRQNLYDFLRMRRNRISSRQSVDELLEIKRDRGLPLFWIDQICINQGKDDEKSHQVNQMADIYSAAYVVETWLGSGFEGSDELMDLITYEGDLSHQIPPPMFVMSNQELRTFIPSLRQFVRLPYWSRLWVTQEIVLGRLVQIRIGAKTLSWETFYPGWLRLERAWNGLHDTDKHENLETKEGKGLYRIHEINSSRDSTDKSWDSVMLLLKGTECENPRDRVFGMMGMLHPSLRVFPDYAMHPQEILLELLTKQVAVSYTESNYNEYWKDSHIRADCILTAANWLPQLEESGVRIDRKSVRRYILTTVPLPPFDPDDGFSRLHPKLTPQEPSWLWQVLFWKSYDPDKFKSERQMKYHIWKAIPNEQNMLWRIVRGDYKRFVHISNLSRIKHYARALPLD